MKTSIFRQSAVIALLSGFGFAQQNLPPNGHPPAPASATPAIAYTEMQAPAPQPAGQASSEPIPPAQQQQPEDRPAPGRPPRSRPGVDATPGTSQQDAATSFSGTIIKSGEQFVLSTADNVNFQLDDQERAKKFVGTRVRVRGSVDSTGHKIHVEKIEPLV